MNPFLYSTLWICFLFYLVCNADGGDAERGKPSGRIKDGKPANIVEFPWAVTVRGSAYRGGNMCGGSILSSKWVVTAAHCIILKPGYVTAGQTKGHSPYIRHRWYVDKPYTEHPTFREVNIKNDKGEEVLVSMRDDIALLKLKTELPLSKSASIKPIRLSPTNVKTNQQCQVAGWGDIEHEGPRSSTLLKMDVKIERNCNHMSNTLINPEDNICIKSSTQQACEGDSGGALVCKENGEYFLKGVLSIGTTCELQVGTSAFTKINNYVDWIEKETGLDLGLKKDRPVEHARMYKQIANAGYGMDNGGNASDTPNIPAISYVPARPDEVNDLDGSYTLDGDTAQPQGHDVPDDSKGTSGLDNHDGAPRPDEVNDLDGSYKLDGDTAQPRGHDVPDDSKGSSGLDNHDGAPRPEEVNDLDGSYKLDGDTAQPRGHDVPDDSKGTSGLDNHDGAPKLTNSAPMSLPTSKIFLFVGVPIFIIGLIVASVVGIVLIRKSSRLNKDILEMIEDFQKPGDN